jgi:hypothetical protein
MSDEESLEEVQQALRLGQKGVTQQPFRWDACGVDEGGLPVHLPMGVDEHGRGPAGDSEAAFYVCWCMDSKCLLTGALKLAWMAGTRGMGEG